MQVRFALVLAVVVFFVLIILISRFRPGLDEQSDSPLPDPANLGDPLENPQLIRLRTEVSRLAEDFAEQMADGSADLEDLSLLEKAIEQQRRVIRLRGSEIAPRSDLDSLEELLALYDEEMGNFLDAQSTRLEAEAGELWEEQNFEEALERLQKARNMQEEIDNQYPRSSARNPSRLHQLNNRILAWQTEPMATQADTLKQEAFDLAASQQYDKAVQSMQLALEIQQQINQSYRSSRFASLARLKEFQQAWQKIQAAEDRDAVDALMNDARTALAEGRQEEALDKAEQAAILQSRILSRHRELGQESQEKLQEIEILRDTGASLPSYKRIQELSGQAREALRSRDVESFKSVVAQWLRETQNFVRSYQKSEFIGNVDDAEVSYLHDRREDIPGILEMVYNGLGEVPGLAGIRMYRTEVPQLLYSSVTGENPANSKDPQHPVESVTWVEAAEFIHQLSWILAKPVSLPEKDIFRRALGPVDQEALAGSVWSRENSNRETQPVGTAEPNVHQFYDLLGNVAEWLASPSSETPDRVIAAGGAVRDSLYRLLSVPEESREPNERNRFVGFRFVVREN